MAIVCVVRLHWIYTWTVDFDLSIRHRRRVHWGIDNRIWGLRLLVFVVFGVHVHWCHCCLHVLWVLPSLIQNGIRLLWLLSHVQSILKVFYIFQNFRWALIVCYEILYSAPLRCDLSVTTLVDLSICL